MATREVSQGCRYRVIFEGRLVFHRLICSMFFRTSAFSLAAALLLLAAPTHAQRKTKTKVKTESGATISAATRLQPLFGNLTATQAEAALGSAFITSTVQSFASRAEASRFFSSKGYEYLNENQADTAAYRFNLAWVLDPKNPDAYRGLGVIASRNPTPDEAISLLNQSLALDAKNVNTLSDLGASYLIRYQQSKKKKDLTTALGYLQQAVAMEGGNGVAWQHLGRAYYFQEDYTKAWEAIHKGQQISLMSLDFDLIADLKEKMPDPAGQFK